jgi:hypothetical protein
MCASPLDFLRGGPPPPRVVLLPDAVFFSRTLPVPAGATRAEVAAQVGLALETVSPFPLAQVYYGYFWPEGSPQALAFAAYRRRFTAEQTEAWRGTGLVIPAFAAVLGYPAQPATTLVLAAPDGLTAVHWHQGAVPSSVQFAPLAPEAPDEERAAVRARLVRAAGEAAQVIDVAAAPVPLKGGDREFTFGLGELRSTLPADTADALDVRDKGELAALARARRRDLLLWRVAAGSVAAGLLLVLGELALVGAGLWEKARLARVAARKAQVAHIMEEQELAVRIDDLSTKRLLPLEMISAAAPEVAEPKAPPAIQFLHASATTLGTIEIDAQTSNAGEIAGYKTALEQAPGIDRVEIREQRARDNIVSFKLVITFKPGMLLPATS